MKKVCLLLVLCLAFTACTFASEIYIIRKIQWGMSVEEVMEAEKDTPVAKTDDASIVLQDDKNLWYVDHVFNKDVLLHYIFYKNKLEACVYDFRYTESDININEDFLYMLKKISEKYGIPDKLVLPSGKNYSEQIKVFPFNDTLGGAFWSLKDKKILLRLFPKDNFLFPKTNRIVLNYEPPSTNPEREKY